MRPITLALIAVILGVTPPTSADTIVFVDGTRMEVKKHEVKGAMVVLTGMDGKLRSVPSAFVNFEATAKANRSATVASEPSAQRSESRGGGVPGTVKEDSSAPKSAPVKSGASPQPQPSPPPVAAEPTRASSSSATPAGSRASVPEAPPPSPAPPAPAPPPGRIDTVTDIPAPKPLPPNYPSTEVGGAQSWSDEELRVSLVIPSSAWRVREAPASFDVAVQFDKPSGDARTTLALIRRPMRNYGAFQKVLIEIQNSAAGSPGFRPLLSKRQMIGPYTAYEVRFLKDSGGRTSFNRLVSFYSKDMIYTLSMSCPEERLADNDPDFEAFVLGLQIKKSRDEVVPKGAPGT